MNRNHVSLLHRFLSIVLILLVTAQCVATPATLNAPTGSTSNDSGGPASTVAASQSGKPTIEESGEPVTVDLSNLPNLGSTTFAVDSSVKAEGEYKADGSELKLELTDSAGLTWTLVIPDQALDYPQKISMISLKDLSSEDIIGNLVGGVMLEPDGLQFIIPARLSVTGSAIQGTTLLLGGNQDGSQVNFLIPDSTSGDPTALIYHFSTAMGDNLDDQQIPSMLKQAMATFVELAKQAKQMLKSPISTPTPPSTKLRCMTEDESQGAEEKFQKFLDEFNSPEIGMVSSLLGARRNIELLGGDAEEFSLEINLLKRQVTKVENLIKTYGKNAEYLPAITSVALSTMRNIGLLGGDDSITQNLASQLPTLWEKAIDQLFKELVEQHEYRNVSAIINAARNAALLGSQLDTDKVFEKLRKAMHFDVELKYTLNLATAHHWKFEANFPLEAKWDTATLRIEGDGTGNFSSYVYDGAPEYTATTPAFSVNAGVTDFYPCDGTAKFSVDQFFPPSETVTITDEDGVDTVSSEITKAAWETHFGDKLVDGRYTFEVNINNNSENAVDQTITQAYGPNETLFEIKLKHTPQK